MTDRYIGHRPVLSRGRFGVEGMLDGVLQELRQRDRQGRRHVGGYVSQIANGPDHDGLGGNHRVLRHLHQGQHDLRERHLITGISGQDLVYQRDRADASFGFVERHARRSFFHPAGLKAQ